MTGEPTVRGGAARRKPICWATRRPGNEGGIDPRRARRQRRANLFSLFRQFYERPGVRMATGNLGWLVIEKLARLVFSVLVGFWMARYLGPADFGQLNYALALVAVGMAVAECGVEAIVKRELIRAPEQGQALLRAAWVLRLGVGAGSYALWGIWMWLSPADGRERVLLAVVGLLLFQPALAVADIWLQATLRARTAVLAQVAMLGVGAAVRVILIRAGAPVWTFGAVAAGELLSGALLLSALARRAGLRFAAVEFSPVQVRALFRESWPFLFSSLAVIFYMRIDVVMLRWMQGDAAAGIYAAAVKLSEIWYFLPVALGSSVLPALLRARAAGREPYGRRLQQYFDLSAALAYGLSVPVALLAPWLVRLVYGASFAAAAPVLVVHVWVAVFAFVGVARAHFLMNEGLGRLHLTATAGGALLNVGLNGLLIPRFGPVGAALATLAAQAVVTWLSSFCFAPVRWIAWMQTRALLIPFTGFRYVRRNH